ncbi:hypothetical protein Ae201684_016631 [Aphanomyces euteiches]|uniref:Uncharacterized protein n=1 Tax=Aphanomyces euteiches TaxID=100861 RepID=A0A6G0WEI6_9STRA|nr:hypothetical protein Ae201684_016631 [Aphanomyces euteiches]
MNDVEAAQAKRTAWETSHPDWNPTDEEYMALLKSTKILAESCQLFDQLCQNTLLRIKEKEANQRCQDNDLIDTAFEAFCQILGILGLVCSYKHEQNQICLDFGGNISFDFS